MQKPVSAVWIYNSPVVVFAWANQAADRGGIFS